MNKKQLVKCVRDGFNEDMTTKEDVALDYCLTIGLMGTATTILGIGVGAMTVVKTGFALTIVGGALATASVGKAFIRGFREQWKIEMKHNNK